MSTMPAEGSQSPQEMANLADVPTSPVTKAKTPDESTPRRPFPGDPARAIPQPNNHFFESVEGVRQNSSPPATTPATNLAHSEQCEGTAHFYRQTVERLPCPLCPRTSHSEPSRTRVNGTSTKSALDSEQAGSHCSSDTWALPGPSSEVCRHDEWQIMNGYQRSDSLHNGIGPGDDMENYFNANAHMLAYLDLQEGTEDPSAHSAHCPYTQYRSDGRRRSSTERSTDNHSLSGYRNGYGSDDGIILNGSESSGRSQDRLSAHRVKLSTSSEEQGDFIETDISLPALESESCGNSMSSSLEDDLPQLTTLSALKSCERRTGSDHVGYSSDATQRPTEGPSLLPPSHLVSPHPSSVCDYKNGSSEASRPASFGVSNRLCTCSVVAYSRRRPLAASNQSSSDLEADEGVGGMKVSPIEPSPVESEGRTACGITVTSDSSSYFSPEDVDFMDFDMATPSDNVGEFEIGTNITHSDGSLHPAENKDSGANSSQDNGEFCADCRKLEQNCLCASLRVCKRLLEGANAQKHATSEQVLVDGFNERKRLCGPNSRPDNVQTCNCCMDSVAGRDSGSGSQENLDTLSCDDEDQDDSFDNLISPPHRTCSCDYQTCGQRDPPRQTLSEDTNNLDVEVFSAAPSSDYEDELFNVSRQTSTSNFDQDENAYQDAVEDCASNGFHSACSGSDLESEKSNHLSNHHEESSGYVEQPSPRPPEIPLPIPARSQDHGPRQPPSLPPSSPGEDMTHHNGCPDCDGAERQRWLPYDNELSSPHWVEYDLHQDRRHSGQHRHRLCPVWVRTGEDDSPGTASGYFDQGFSTTQAEITTRVSGPDRNMALGEDQNAGALKLITQCSEDRPDEEQEPAFPDPLPDIFIVNMLREKESRALYTSRSRPTVEKVMIWNEYDAYVLQVKQIGASACGATAIINVLKAFNIHVDKTLVSASIKTNTRAEKAPVAEYLLSRSIAGCTAQHLMEGIEEVTGGEIVARFFCFYPDREVDICHWLGTWIRRGAVPVLTLNLQRAVPQGWDVPDAWHHQMAYGVGPKGVYLTNPLEIVPEDVIREQLTSESELLVQRQDVISRWTADTDLSGLLTHPDNRWRQFNVIGQVVNILREARRPRVLGFRPQLTPHVRIPAWYRPGVTLFVRNNSEAHQELLNAPPLLVRQSPTVSPEQPVPLSSSDAPNPLCAASTSTSTTNAEVVPDSVQIAEEEEDIENSDTITEEPASEEGPDEDRPESRSSTR